MARICLEPECSWCQVTYNTVHADWCRMVNGNVQHAWLCVESSLNMTPFDKNFLGRLKLQWNAPIVDVNHSTNL